MGVRWGAGAWTPHLWGEKVQIAVQFSPSVPDEPDEPDELESGSTLFWLSPAPVLGSVARPRNGLARTTEHSRRLAPALGRPQARGDHAQYVRRLAVVST
jgi:hypothetical protein